VTHGNGLAIDTEETAFIFKNKKELQLFMHGVMDGEWRRVSCLVQNKW
jgi:hypothetical protein